MIEDRRTLRRERRFVDWTSGFRHTWSTIVERLRQERRSTRLIRGKIASEISTKSRKYDSRRTSPRLSYSLISIFEDGDLSPLNQPCFILSRSKLHYAMQPSGVLAGSYRRPLAVSANPGLPGNLC